MSSPLVSNIEIVKPHLITDLDMTYWTKATAADDYEKGDILVGADLDDSVDPTNEVNIITTAANNQTVVGLAYEADEEGTYPYIRVVTKAIVRVQMGTTAVSRPGQLLSIDTNGIDTTGRSHKYTFKKADVNLDNFIDDALLWSLEAAPANSKVLALLNIPLLSVALSADVTLMEDLPFQIPGSS